MKTKIAFLLVATAFIACKNVDKNDKQKIKATYWLLGNWETKTDFGILSENWNKLNDSTFQAKSCFLKDKDTIHNESIILQQKGETFIYTTTIKGQNDDKPIRFELTANNENELVFENLKNDYPQKISYTKMPDGKLTTEISGMQAGKHCSEKYILAKTQ
jgi:hypothetical protein